MGTVCGFWSYQRRVFLLVETSAARGARLAA